MRKQPWITDEILELCDKRRSLKAIKHQSNKHAEKYRIVHNIIRRSMKGKKKTNHLVYLGGRTFNNLRIADDIDLIAGSKSELQTIIDALEKTSTAHGMEINHDKCW